MASVFLTLGNTLPSRCDRKAKKPDVHGAAEKLFQDAIKGADEIASVLRESCPFSIGDALGDDFCADWIRFMPMSLPLRDVDLSV